MPTATPRRSNPDLYVHHPPTVLIFNSAASVHPRCGAKVTGRTYGARAYSTLLHTRPRARAVVVQKMLRVERRHTDTLHIMMRSYSAELVVFSWFGCSFGWLLVWLAGL